MSTSAEKDRLQACHKSPFEVADEVAGLKPAVLTIKLVPSKDFTGYALQYIELMGMLTSCIQHISCKLSVCMSCWSAVQVLEASRKVLPLRSKNLRRLGAPNSMAFKNLSSRKGQFSTF